MMRSINPGKFDHVLTFYAPSRGKDSIGDTLDTMAAQSGTVRGERVFKSADERIEAQQQVGVTTQDFRIMDVRSQHAITLQWQFDVYQISNPSLVKRYKIRSIEDEGRRNFLRITGELKDNG